MEFEWMRLHILAPEVQSCSSICAIKSMPLFVPVRLLVHLWVYCYSSTFLFFCFTVCGWVAVHPDCWCICLCYLHFAPENIEDGKIYLLVPAYLGCPKESPESCKMVVCKCIYGRVFLCFPCISVLHPFNGFFPGQPGKPTPWWYMG